MEKKDVFISYKSEEFDEASWVKSTLEHNGISCWMAPMSIPGGSSYAVEIPAAIRQCEVFVLILSEQSQLSKWVPRELDQAINEAKVIMPFMLENCQLKDDFNFYLTNVQRYEAYKSKSKTIEKMIREIKAILQKKDEEEKCSENLPETPPQLPPEETPVQPAPAAPAKKKEQPALHTKKKPQGAERSKKKIPAVLWVLLSVVLVIALISVISTAVKKANEITVAGTVFEKDDYVLRLEGQTLTAADMEKLLEFKQLGYIELKNCTISTADLSNMTSHDLTQLELSDCQLSNTQLQTLDLESQDRLSDLDISGNPELTELSVLAPLYDNLRRLDISGVGVSDIKMLESFTKLRALSVCELGLTELTALTGMIYLEELYASDNQLQSLEGLENVTLLQKVNLSGNGLTDVSLLSKSAESLRVLYLDNNSITDLECLRECTGLEMLSANNNQLRSLGWLHGCTNLYWLSASNNQIETVAGLSDCQSLTTLDLSNNALKVILPDTLHFKAEGYINVDLSGNRLVSCTLPANCYYTTLELQGNAFADMSVLQGLEGGKVCFTYPEGMKPDSLSGLGIYNYYIIDCPLDQRVAVQEVLSSVSFVTAEEAQASFKEGY